MLNATQHKATPGQIAAGVFDLPAPVAGRLHELLTFVRCPDRAEVLARADQIADLVTKMAEPAARSAAGPLGNGDVGAACTDVMIGGALWLMGPLEQALLKRGLQPYYAFSERVSVEQPQPDGSVRKTNEFRHAGFVPAVGCGVE